MPRLVVCAFAAMILLVVGACGGADAEPTDAEYARAVVTAVDRTDFALARVTRAKSMDELANRLSEAGVVISSVANDLEEGGAPSVYADENKRLVTALETLGNDVSSTAEQIQQPGSEMLLTGAQGLSFDSWDQANLALGSLIGSGLPVQTLQRH
jgi:hypothetical protein